MIKRMGEYIPDIFDSRAEEGFEGNGYDWESLANVFLQEECPELENKIHFDSESSMFVAYSQDAESLKKFILYFKETCENKDKILDLFSRAELD